MPRRTSRVVNVVLGVLLAAGVALGYAAVGTDSSAQTVTRTGTVRRGVVMSSATASGNVEAGVAASANFVSGGTLAELDVNVGDPVVFDQVIARLDTTTLRQTLSAAQANLVSAQAKLSVLQAGLTPQQQAQNGIAVQQSQQQVANAQAGVSTAQNNAATNATQYQAAVDTAQSTLDSDTAGGKPSTQLTQDQTALTNAKNAQTNGTAKDQQGITSAQQQLAGAQLSLQSTQAANATKAAPPTADQVAGDRASIVQAQNSVAAAQKALDDATLRAPLGGIVTAVNGTVGASVSGGGSSVSSATSSGSSGSSGSTGASSSTGASAGGGGGATGGAAGGSSGSSGSTASGSTGSGSSGSALVTITNLGRLDVKTSFSESDVAKIKVGMPATVSFSALTTTQLAGHVSSIDTTSTVTSNVVTYGAHIALDQSDPAVKPGMTASVTVIIDKADNVVNVPSAAVTGRGNVGTVTVVKGTKESTRTVTIGLRGDDTTEIVSGLKPGETIVVSRSTLGNSISNATNGAGTGTNGTGTRTGTGTLGGGGGLGGGGFGGGGFGPPGGGR